MQLKIIKNQNDSIVVVVSALGGVTNLLMEMLAMAESGKDNFKSNLSKIEKLHLEPIKKCIPIQNQSGIISYLKKHLNELESRIDAIFLLEEVTKKNNALVAAYGEILSSNIIQEIFKYNKINSELKDARELIQTSTHNGREIVNENVTDQQIKNYFNKNKSQVVLVPGFIASNKSVVTTTLGRGGSDYSAAIIANSIEADIFEIWTDVSGIYTAHPKIVTQAKPIKKLSYYEAMELSHFGAKVIYPPTLQPIIEKNIPIVEKNTVRLPSTVLKKRFFVNRA